MKLLQITALLIAFVGCGWVHAQEAAKQNVKKELAAVLKDLPQDVQLQILEFAQRKSEAWERSQAALTPAQPAPVAAAPAPQQAVAKPQPTAAPVAEAPKPATVQQAATVQVNPAAASQVAGTPAAQPAQPARPEWMTQAEGMTPTTATWSETDFDFGIVEEGPTVTHIFKFKNTGAVPLKLTYVKASCGCTTPKWSEEAVAPGGEGIIEVAFNTRGRVGIQQKSVTVAGNFEGNTIQVLRFKCEVKAAAPVGGK